MSLTGLFLILFLVIHLIGNLQLLNDDNGESFNVYAYFMTHNPIIVSISYGLYFFIMLHAVLGIVIAIRNRKARGSKRYAVQTTSNTRFASRNMALMGSLIFVFLVIHMGNFWYQMKFTTNLPMITYEGYTYEVKDLYQRVSVTFTQVWFVILYVISMVVLAFHLLHGFQSAFQTLGWNHRKYTPILKVIGIIYAIVVPIAFAIIPIAFYLQNK